METFLLRLIENVPIAVALGVIGYLVFKRFMETIDANSEAHNRETEVLLRLHDHTNEVVRENTRAIEALTKQLSLYAELNRVSEANIISVITESERRILTAIFKLKRDLNTGEYDDYEL